MSEPMTALNGATYNGFARVEDAGPRGMITLRGELSDATLQAAAKDATGTDFPDRGRICSDGDNAIAWMSPDEVLILCRYDDVPDKVAALSQALSGVHHLVANVSDARALISVSGGDARDVFAKLSPADLTPDAFEPGQFRRTRLAQVPAAFWMREDGAFDVICFRSVARYVFDVLKVSAAPGSEVDFF